VELFTESGDLETPSTTALGGSARRTAGSTVKAPAETGTAHEKYPYNDWPPPAESPRQTRQVGARIAAGPVDRDAG
jgi:hypothetical protein